MAEKIASQEIVAGLKLKCHKCDGKGTRKSGRVCRKCKGSGELQREYLDAIAQIVKEETRAAVPLILSKMF